MPHARPKNLSFTESTLSHTISTPIRIRSAFFLRRTQLENNCSYGVNINFLFSLLREQAACLMQLEEEPKIEEKEEDLQSDYLDDSFDQESSEEDRTPTFEFNMSPPSIGNSGCEDLNEVLPNLKVRHIGDEDTASDQSEIEDDPLTCEEPEGATGGILQSKQSCWKFFAELPRDTNHEVAKDETFKADEATEEHLDLDEVIEINNDSKLAVDKELDRMDEEIFGLLRSSPQPSKDRLPGPQQVSIVYPGDNDEENVSPGTDSRKRKVRIAIEPEVFLVPFSSREFDEPLFEDTESASLDNRFESRFKHLNLNPLSRECGDEPYGDVKQDISEEMILEDLDHDEEDYLAPGSNGFYKKEKEQHNGGRIIEEVQSASESNTSDENELSVNEGKTEDTLHSNKENIPVRTDEDMSTCGVQKGSLFENVNLDPYSQELMRNAEDLPNDSEDYIQGGRSLNVATKVDHVEYPGANGVNRQDKKPKNVSNVMKERQLPSESIFTSENEITTEKMGCGIYLLSKNISVDGECNKDLPDQKNLTSKDVCVDPYTSDCLDEVDNLLDSVEEDIPEEITSDDNDLDKATDTEPLSFVKGCSLEKSQAEAVAETELPCQMCFNGRDSQDLEETKMGHENEPRSKNSQKADEETVLEQGEQEMSAVLHATLNHKPPTTQLSMIVESHNGNDDFQPNGDSNVATHRTDKLFVEDTDSSDATLLTGAKKRQDDFRGGNVVLMSMKFENNTKETERGSEADDETELEGLAESGKNTESSLEKDKMKMDPEYLYTMDNLHAEIKTLKEHNEELNLELEDKNQENYTIQCIIRSVNIENEKLLDQVENLEDELKTALSEKGNLELELDRRSSQKAATPEQMTAVADKLATEIKSLKKHNEQLKLQLEESDMQRSNMDSIVEQLNVENEKLLENMDGLATALSQKRAKEVELEECLKEAKKEQEILRNRSIDIKSEIEESNEEEIKGIAAELGRLKELHAKISDMRLELCGKKEPEFEVSLEKTEASQSRLSLLQELSAVVLSVVEMSEDFKDTMLQVLEDSAQHKTALDTDLKEIKEEYLKTLDQQNMEIMSLKMYNEDLEIQLEGKSITEERGVEISRLKKQNEQLKLQLEECDVQRRNMDCIVEQLNIEKEELLENMDGLESALSQHKATELDLKEFLKEAEKENESLRDRLKDIETERTSPNEAEIMDIAAQLETLKQLHTKIDVIRKTFCGEKEVVLEKCLEKTEAPQSRVSLLQELRAVMLSIVQMSDDLKDSMFEMLEDQSAQHKIAVHTDLTEVKEECLKTSDEQNTETKSLELQNEELKGRLEESDKEGHNVECKIESVNVENEKLLERIHVLENKLDAALDKKNDIEKELNEKNTKDEYRERELSNLRETMRRKTFNWEEMDASLDQLWNDKQKLEEELGFMTASLEESEASKSELVKEMNRTKLHLEKLKDQQADCNNMTNYAYLREQCEHLKGSLELSRQNEAWLKKELESTMARSSPTGIEAQQKDQYKIRIEELERENTSLLQKLARSFDCEEKSENVSRNLQREIKTIQEELHQFRDESIHTLRNVNRGKRGHKKLKKRLVRNEEGITSLARSFQKDLQEKKDMDNELKRQIQNYFQQIKSLMKLATENKIDEKKQYAGEERMVKQMKELKSVLETTLLNVQKTESECEMNRCNLNLQIQKSQELENKYQELNKRLQKMEYELDVNKRMLKEKDDRIEQLNLQLHSEKEDKLKSHDAAESRSRRQVMDKEHEINSLRRLLADSDENVQNMQEKLLKIKKDFESTKETLAQRDKELASAKASLSDGDQLLHTFRQSFTDLQSELEETRRGLIEKSVALEYTERYTEMLFKSTKTKDREIDLTNKLVTRVAQNVDRVEKLLEKEMVKAVNESCQGATTENELSGDQSNEGNTKNSLESQLQSVLEGKDKTIQQLESALIQLNQDLEMTSASLKEKDNDLQQVVTDFKRQETELEISNGRSSKLEDETNSLRNELTQLNTLLSQRDDEMNELKELVATRDSQLKTESCQVEKLKILLQTKENGIERMKYDLAKEEYERKSLTEHLQKKMDEITCLQQALDFTKTGPCKSPADNPGIIAHMKASGQSEIDLEGLRKTLGHKVCNGKGEINHFGGASSKLEKDLVENNFLQPGTNEQLTKTNLGDTRLRQLEETFEAYKQNASEKESKLKKESNALEERSNNVEINLCQKQKEFLKRQELKATEWEGNDNPLHANIHHEERSSWSAVNEEKEHFKVEIAHLAGNQIANAMTDRMHQMVTDMCAMQMELESQRDEYSTLTNRNKHLKERVEKLEKQALKKDKIHSDRLNNVLDNVRMKRKEIQGLKSLLNVRESQREAGMSEVSSQ